MGATDRVFGNPLHPYTRRLLASVPQLHRRWEPLEPEPEPLEPEPEPPAGDGQALLRAEDDHFVAGGVAG
jgi:peptide/nickel transport system ATP-binding protein